MTEPTEGARPFRKRPVVIEARQCPPWENVAEHHTIASWCHGHYGADEAGEYMLIDTLEGAHKARPGDWIIKGVAGEFYPCKPDIFAATYEPVEPRAAGTAPGPREGQRVSDAPPDPYTIWTLDAPFDKHGVPRMGNVGQSIRHVVVIEAKTFQRMLREHPSLNTAAFRVGAYASAPEVTGAPHSGSSRESSTTGEAQSGTPTEERSR